MRDVSGGRSRRKGREEGRKTRGEIGRKKKKKKKLESATRSM